MSGWLTRSAVAVAMVAILPAWAGAQQLHDPPKAVADSSARDPGGPELASAAAAVRRAWLAHDAAKIVANSPQLMIQLPGADPSAALGARQAAALLSDFLATAEEVDLKVRAKGVNAERGYVELVRRYRINGTQDVRAQSLYLGYRRGPRSWILAELRVAGEP